MQIWYLHCEASGGLHVTLSCDWQEIQRDEKSVRYTEQEIASEELQNMVKNIEIDLMLYTSREIH